MRHRQPATDAPRIYTTEYFQRIFDMEGRHWWAVGMRTILDRLLRTVLADRPDVTILDAGCGTGLMLSWLERYSSPPHIVGVDISATALRFCRMRRLPRVAQASVTQLPFHDNTFDLITCSDVLQHLPRDGSDEQALTEYLRVLKPGGILYLRTNVYPGSLGRNGQAPERRLQGGDFHQYSRPELVELFARAGFRIERLTYANMLPALAATWLGRFRGDPCNGDPDDYRGLRMRVPARWMNAVLTLYMQGEASYLSRSGRALPYGHSLLCVASKPVQAGPAPSSPSEG